MPEETLFVIIYFGVLLLAGLVMALVPMLKNQHMTRKTPQEEQEFEIVKDAISCDSL